MTDAVDISPALPSRYRGPWRHFRRWCAVYERVPLPAHPVTIAAYLDHEAAPLATQRTRLSAINAAHLAYGLPAPGRAAVLREALNAHLAQRNTRLAARVEDVLAKIPVWGWTRGLFGRRNAALLVLAAHGLTYPQIAALTQRDLVVTDDEAVIGTELARISATDDPELCPVAVLRRWVAVLCLAPRPAGRGLLQHHLTHRSLPDADPDPAHTHLPLFTSFDPRGYTPMHDNEMVWLQPLSVTTIATIIGDHLRGPLPVYRTRAAAPPRQKEHRPLPAIESVELEDTYAQGVAARHRDHERFKDIDELWAKIDAAADRTAQILAEAWKIADAGPAD